MSPSPTQPLAGRFPGMASALDFGIERRKLISTGTEAFLLPPPGLVRANATKDLVDVPLRALDNLELC